MWHNLVYIVLATLTAVVPLLQAPDDTRLSGRRQIAAEWPEYFMDKRLSPLPLSEEDKVFAQDFPGEIRKYQAGSDQLILRLLNRPTRKLHPAVDCFRGSGFSVTFKPIRVDREGHRWGCFEAAKRKMRLRVCERIFDQFGGEYTDVSAWFWNATFDQSPGFWWAYTLVEEVSRGK
jgi:hypothetical protein